jgi:uncharacterized coiled-coil DUF342 family protein
LPARTAGAQAIFGSDPEGLKRTDGLIKKAEELVKEAASARERIGRALDAYDSIFADDVTDVRKAYKSVEGEIEKCEKKREEVRKKLDAMTVEAEAYFAGWSDSLQQIGTPDLRKKSEARMAETRGHFEGILAAVRAAREVYESFITSMKDQWTYLGHDLNPNGIASLKPDADKLRSQAKELFEKIDAGTKKASEYIDSLRSSRPVT